MSKVWFITGTSRGLGRAFAESALERGDKVAATARNVAALDDLVTKYGDDAVLPLALDVTDKAAVAAAVAAAHEKFGRLDVVVNNAGYGLFGMVEEVTEQQLRDQMETNLFGAFWVTQAVLPILRAQGSGHIVQISSVGGVAAFPSLGAYHASKWALEGFSDSLAQEVAGVGIKVTIVEPGGFTTDWAGSSAVHAEPNPAYDQVREAIAARFGDARYGEPADAGAALLQIVDAENPPLRVLFGTEPIEIIKPLYAQRLQDLGRLGARLPDRAGLTAPAVRRRRRARPADDVAGSLLTSLSQETHLMSVPQTPHMFGASTTAAEVIDGVDLHGRRAVVTGASSGIGVETARALAAAGADVTLAVRDTDAGARVAARLEAELPPESGQLTVGRLDLADRSTVAAFVAAWHGPVAHPGQQRRSDGPAGTHPHT